MEIILWIILIGVITWFLFYRRKLMPHEIQNLISERIASITDETRVRLENSHLKDYLDYEKHFFLTMEENYLRLAERFRHDKIKQAQITKDWISYNEIINGLIHEREMLDVSTSDENAENSDQETKKLQIKRQEIETRFKELLGKQFNDPMKIIKK